MPTRKQRRRRQKSFRHEYGFVDYDDEGNEVELTGSELRARKDPPEKEKARPAAAAKGKQSSAARRARDPEPPTWRRAGRRGLIWSPAMILLSYIVFKSEAVGLRIGIGVVYAGLFIPMSYWIDAMVYRRFERRRLAGGGRPEKPR